MPTATPDAKARCAVSPDLRDPTACRPRTLRWRCGSAQGLVEFALVIPIFLSLFFGLIEFGWAVYGYSTAQSMANEGARRAMVINRPASYYGLSDNATGTGKTLPACPPDLVNTNPPPAPLPGPTILQAIACHKGVLPDSRIRVDLVTFDPNDYTSGQPVPANRELKVVVKYTYQQLIAYPVNFGPNFVMEGFTRAFTQ